MAHYLDPKYDLTFKRVFGEHKHLCMSLINSMIPLKEPIVDVEYKTGELIPDLEILRNTIVDVRCVDGIGRQFIVEMQLFWYEGFKKRVMLNASKAYVMQLDAAEKFAAIHPVYSLNFVNMIFEKSPDMADVYFHHYKITNIDYPEKRLEDFEFIFIELPKFKPKNRAEKHLHDLWLRFLTEIDENTVELSSDLLENDDIKEAIDYMERGAYTKEQLESYDKKKIDLMTASSMLEESEAIGIAIGLEKGEVIGIEKGKTINQREVIANGHKAGVSVEIMAMMTGLTQEEVRKIIEELKNKE